MNGVRVLGGRPIDILRKDELLRVYQSAVDVLKDPGVRIDHEEALNILGLAGADVDTLERIAHIPSSLVDRALRQAPRILTLCGKDPQFDFSSGTGEVHFSSGHAAMSVIDLDTRERRPATKSDLADNVRLHDALENTHLIFPELYPQDVSPKALDRHISQTLLTNTWKPVVATAYDGKGAQDLLRMGLAIAGSADALRQRPMFTVSCGAISPLTFAAKSIDVLLEICRFGIPCQIYTIPSSGGTGPVTLAGTLTLALAELLAGLVLSQLAKPGAPVRLMGYPSTIDQRHGSFTFATPEAALMNAAVAQMFRHLGVPHAVHGATTRANVLDAQAGYETGMLDLFAALSGSELVVEGTSSSLENTALSVHEQAVIGNEICAMVYRMLRGIEVNDDTLALSVIRDVGPGGQFLTHRHTRDFHRLENWDANISNRLDREGWLEAGGVDIGEKAREQARTILDKPAQSPLNDTVQRELQQIVDEAEN